MFLREKLPWLFSFSLPLWDVMVGVREAQISFFPFSLWWVFKIELSAREDWFLCYNHFKIFLWLNQDLSREDPTLDLDFCRAWVPLIQFHEPNYHKAIGLDEALDVILAKGKPLEREYVPSGIGSDSGTTCSNSMVLKVADGSLRKFHEPTALVASSNWTGP